MQLKEIDDYWVVDPLADRGLEVFFKKLVDLQIIKNIL